MNGIIIHDHEFTPYWVERLRTALLSDAPLDVLALHPVGGQDATAALQRLTERVKTPVFRALYEQIADMGLCLEYEMHALSWLLPRERFASHPAWFRQNEKGDRTPDANLCPSNEAALAYVEERTALLATLLPQRSHRYFYWLDDVAGKACYCPRCRELSASDQALLITNRMLRGLRRVDPCATLAYLAYQDTLTPPTRIRPEPGIFLEYAPFRRDLSRPLNDPMCEQNAAELRHLRPLLDFFGRDGAQALDYWMDNSLHCRWKLPYRLLPFYPEVIAADARYYRELGFSHLTSFACFLGEDYAAQFGHAPIEEYAGALG